MSFSEPLEIIDQSVLLAELGELMTLIDCVKKQSLECFSQGKPLPPAILKALAVIAEDEKEFAKILARSELRRAESEKLDALKVDSTGQPDQETDFQKQVAELQSQLEEKDRELEAKAEKLDAALEGVRQADELQRQVADLQAQLDKKDRELETKNKELDLALEMIERVDSPIMDSERLSEHEEASYQVITGILVNLLLAKKGVKEKAAFPSEAEVIREIEQLDLYGYKKGTLAKRFKDAREKLENELKKKPPPQYRSTA